MISQTLFSRWRKSWSWRSLSKFMAVKILMFGCFLLQKLILNFHCRQKRELWKAEISCLLQLTLCSSRITVARALRAFNAKTHFLAARSEFQKVSLRSHLSRVFLVYSSAKCVCFDRAVEDRLTEKLDRRKRRSIQMQEWQNEKSIAHTKKEGVIRRSLHSIRFQLSCPIVQTSFCPSPHQPLNVSISISSGSASTQGMQWNSTTAWQQRWRVHKLKGEWA